MRKVIPVYEAILLLKNLPKDKLAISIRRTADAVLKRDGFFRDIKYLGLQKIPYKHSLNGDVMKEAHYIFYEFNVEKKLSGEVLNEWKLDRDTIKYTIFPRQFEQEFNFDNCTFDDEMKAVPYRPQVVELVAKAKNYAKKHSHKKELHLHSPFYPFQR